VREVHGRRVDTTALHGTGCIHSAALCARLARGDDLFDAAVRARRRVEESLRERHRL
jgi:hydroxymethylpyrimidine/phosphomethylpyrimidine kinase